MLAHEIGHLALEFLRCRRPAAKSFTHTHVNYMDIDAPPLQFDANFRTVLT
jgi:hypothetical protein